MGVNLALLVHLLNFILLTMAVFIALRMVRIRDRVLTWRVLAAAFTLMAISPLIDLYGHLSQPDGQHMLEASDSLSTFSALLMLAGVILLRRIVAERTAIQQQMGRQLDELQRFHNLAVGRELRMKELVEENERLRKQLEQVREEAT